MSYILITYNSTGKPWDDSDYQVIVYFIPGFFVFKKLPPSRKQLTINVYSEQNTDRDD